MTSFWKSSIRDNAKNGTVLGLVFGFAIIFGTQIHNFISSLVPSVSNLLLNIYILIAAGIIGYIIDRW